MMTVTYNTILIAGKLGDVTSPPIENSIEDLHAVRMRANRAVNRALGKPALPPNRIRRMWYTV